MGTLPEYAELHCLSNFSFLRGASHAEELVGRAVELGYAALAITDECSLAGIVRAHVAARGRVKLIVGSEFRIEDGLKLVLLAPDRRAYGALSSLISIGRRRSEKGAYALRREDVDAAARGGLLALWVPGEEPVPADAAWLRERFDGRGWIAVELHAGPDDAARLRQLGRLGAGAGLPLVAAGDVHMHARSRRRLQDALTAIRVGKPLGECGYALFPNGERHLRMRAQLAKVYGAGLLEATLDVAERCWFSMLDVKYDYPEEIVPPGETPTSHLRRLALAGLEWRYPEGVPEKEKVRGLIEKELALIAEVRYEAFFLTVYDIVRYARDRQILCQGRGSAANSAVCYCLGITEVEPIKGNALFERFVSRERGEAPDIDVDFEHERREEVIQYVYARYGRDRAAIAATVIRYRTRSALRDLGKALGFGIEEIGRLSKSLAWWDDPEELPVRVREAGLDPEDRRVSHLLALCAELEGFPRHLSQHVGGFVISRGPLAELVPLENAAMENRTIIQWDKDDLESLGLLKVDVLALGMLSALRRALELAGIRRLQDIPRDDPAVYEMIQKADTIGVFQIESRAQMSMLPRLKPKDIYDLVIQVAIVRPGPIQGDMVHPYLRRREGKEPVDYPSEAVKGVLERTLGVPIFQEQVMQIAMVAAGFSADDADRLRRAMAAWKRKGGLHVFEAQLKDGMRERGYSEEFANRIYRQMEGFSNYGFPESHSASFAQLAYASAWIKRHHPGPFLAALLNSQPMGFYSASQLIQDARRHGVEVRPADVSFSRWDCTMEAAAVRLGLRMVKGLGKEAAGKIAAAAPHASVAELAQRASLGTRELNALAAAGALQSIAGHRRDARWAATGVEQGTALLPSAISVESALRFAPASEGEEIAADYGSLGFTLGRHPLALLRSRLRKFGLKSAEEVTAAGKGLVRTAGLVTCRQHPETKTGVVFVTLEDESGNVNVVVWQNVFQRYRRELLGARLLAVEGVIESQSGVVHLIARRFQNGSALLRRVVGELIADSHDFH